MLIGVSYKVESCVAITVNNQTIELSGDPERVKPSVPTFFPNVVESVVNTRASAANQERRGKLIQEVTIQYNLCNEPWLKYSIASVCDQGFKRADWTSARLRTNTLYLETHTQRFELSYDGPVFDEEAENYDEVNAPEADVYRWGRCVQAEGPDGDGGARRAAAQGGARRRRHRDQLDGGWLWPQLCAHPG